MKRQKTIDLSKKQKDKVMQHPNEDVEGFLILDGEQILFYENRLFEINGEISPGQVITMDRDRIWRALSYALPAAFKNCC